jgi:hypothetical protein
MTQNHQFAILFPLVVGVVPVGNLIWLAVDQESGDAVVQ